MFIKKNDLFLVSVVFCFISILGLTLLIMARQDYLAAIIRFGGPVVALFLAIAGQTVVKGNPGAGVILYALAAACGRKVGCLNETIKV
jgi:hypothetical protein